MKFDELRYVPPKVSAQSAAAKAIAVLEDIAKVDAGVLFYVIQASNIIALAGLRAQSPYNLFAPSFSEKRRQLLKRIILEHGCIVMDNNGPYESDDRAYFSVMCRQAWLDLPKRYKILRPIWVQPHKFDDFIDFILWSDLMHLSLVKMLEKKRLPREWLLDWWAPHNLRFGMLLGYTGPAIASYCWDSARHAQGKEPAKDYEINLPFQGIYCGAHVTYDYSSALPDKQVIYQQEELWAEVLTRVYEVFSKDRLAKLPEFVKAYDDYRVYDGYEDTDDLATER